jgi:hypothetical protein
LGLGWDLNPTNQPTTIVLRQGLNQPQMETSP